MSDTSGGLPIDGPLAGRCVVTTRDAPGTLDQLLAAAGARVEHVPLIEVIDVDGHDAEVLDDALARLGNTDWLIVTSRHGAERVGSTARAFPNVRLAAVGTATAAELERWAGRNVDVVPGRQTAGDLVEAMPPGEGESVLVAQADRAEPTLVEGLRARGYVVDAVTAYRTRLVAPTDERRAAALGADAVAFASGSAAEAWATAIGTDTPPIVVAIGPTTAGVARRHHLQVTHVAADHSLAGLVDAVTAALSGAP